MLAALATERQIPATLTLGIYEMSARNTPGIGEVLSRYRLDCLPEAHCYLRYRGSRIDITRSTQEKPRERIEFLHEESITPQQIGAYKIKLHQRYMQKWLAGTRSRAELSFEQLWRIREECIAALGQ